MSQSLHSPDYLNTGYGDPIADQAFSLTYSRSSSHQSGFNSTIDLWSAQPDVVTKGASTEKRETRGTALPPPLTSRKRNSNHSNNTRGSSSSNSPGQRNNNNNRNNNNRNNNNNNNNRDNQNTSYRDNRDGYRDDYNIRPKCERCREQGMNLRHVQVGSRLLLICTPCENRYNTRGLWMAVYSSVSPQRLNQWFLWLLCKPYMRNGEKGRRSDYDC